MSDTIPNFNKQELKLSNDNWKVELFLERGNSENQEFVSCDKTLELCEPGEWTSNLIIRTIDKNQIIKNCLISGLDGGIYLHTSNEKEKSYTVKLSDNCLIFSLGFTFFAYDIDKQEINWAIRPDMAEIFEFYDLEDDYLVRGELAIHRIDKDGQIKWSYGGRDIWVNIEGKTEVVIDSNKIILTDFNNDEYIIDFNGKTLEDKPYVRPTEIKQKKWWKLW